MIVLITGIVLGVGLLGLSRGLGGGLNHTHKTSIAEYDQPHIHVNSTNFVGSATAVEVCAVLSAILVTLIVFIIIMCSST